MENWPLLGTRLPITGGWGSSALLFIQSLKRGLHDLLWLYPVFGPVPADLDQIAAALARKTGSRLQSVGAQAANALGLSTQVPARAVYLTDGRTRSVQAGGQTIELHHAAPRSLTGAGRTEGTVIQALRHLGPEQINVEVIEHLHQTLTTREKTALRREALNAPGWLVPTLQKVAGPALNLKLEPKLTSVSKSTPVAKSKLNTLAKSEILKPS